MLAIAILNDLQTVEGLEWRTLRVRHSKLN